MAKCEEPHFNSERLVYWYLRLNGFLTIEDFVVHPDQGVEQRTDVDLLGVRMQHRVENYCRPMLDDPIVSQCNTLLNVIIGEVKRGTCKLNSPWKNPADENMHRVIRAMGCFPDSEIEAAAQSLYAKGSYANYQCTCRIMAFGNVKANLNVPQITYAHMTEFIHRRFQNYQEEKASVGNWTADGRQLAKLARQLNTHSEFDNALRKIFDLPRIDMAVKDDE